MLHYRCSPRYMSSVHTQTESDDSTQVSQPSEAPLLDIALTSTPIKGHGGRLSFPSTSFCDEDLQPLDQELGEVEASGNIDIIQAGKHNKLEISTVEEDIFQLEEKSENGSDTDSEEETAAAADERQLTPIAGVKAIVWVDQILKLLRDINGTVCKHSFCTVYNKLLWFCCGC
ncbi:uncharacterized protein [Apostichopus japonicus]|uniref:uncharacterized protein n=1 Tax=Stichopus japonicus TaxID=307972 RepID=UPI003AB8745C